MVYELTGKVKLIMEPMTFASGFTKREFVVTDESGSYPQDIKIGCVRDRINALNALKAGDEVRVKFALRGRSWNEKYYVDLDAVEIEKLNSDGTSVTMDEPPVPPEPSFDAPSAPAPSSAAQAPKDSLEDDEMPF